MHFLVVVPLCLLSFYALGSEITPSLLRKSKLNDSDDQVKQSLDPELFNYTRAILLDVDSSPPCDKVRHLKAIYHDIKDINLLVNLSTFFLCLRDYLQISLYERIGPFIKGTGTSFESYMRSIDLGASNIKKHSDWAQVALLTTNFALLKIRLGQSDLNEHLEYQDIPNYQGVDRVIEFIREKLYEYIEKGCKKLSAVEKEAFKLFLSFLKDYSAQEYNCEIDGHKINNKEHIVSPLVESHGHLSKRYNLILVIVYRWLNESNL